MYAIRSYYGQNAKAVAQLDAEAGAIQDHLALLARPERLADILELEHGPPGRAA